ncbi:MAG TPA: phosphate/phosphite/phosphonate ABC transporter substrate-binding protein [Cyclobacteriaceae bacterium]|nr:phosphate/phosphite/phosphonate ABC transporter substrate-binding protein [Cyclobacteriaceae bacterium]HRJ80661.1 phosphate/phosphite/phosphonate ABC transporter substrate-binding protein [Cyclobacteriaceae bacterium]
MLTRYLLVVSTLFSGVIWSQDSRHSAHKLIISTYQYADNPRIKNIEPFARHFGEANNLTVEVKSYPKVQELVKALENEEVDVAFMNTLGYLMLKEKSQAYETGVVLNIPKEKENAYKSVLATGANIAENTLEEVVAHASDFVLVLVSPGSTSGNLVPRLKLASLQPGYPERFFLEIQYTNNHALAAQRALKGEVALCAFGSNEYYKLGADTVRMKKLWESPAIPLGPVVYRKKLPESLRDELQKSLLSLHIQNPEALEAIKSGWTEALPADRYISVAEDYYESLLRLSNNPAVSMSIIRNFAKD